MSRVSKVILGAHAILINGGMFAVTGSLLTATAARAHSTTVMVCAGQFKLTPLWNLYHEYGALDFDDPSGVLGFEEGDLVDKVDVVNPYYDYVRPELVDVYVTNEYVCLLLSPSRIDRHPPAAIIHRRRCTGKRINTAIVPDNSNIPGSSRNHTMTKTMSYERGCHFAHVLLIADMLYAQDGSGVYISVDSNGSECITWASLDVCSLLGIGTSRTSRTQNLEESLLRKVHAADPLHFTFPFLLVFQVFHLSFVMSWPTAPVSPE